MTDLISELLPRLAERRFPELNLPAEFIFPDYSGYSLFNLTESICAWLEAPGLNGSPLGKEYLSAWGKGIRRVVVFLLDGMGLELFQQAMEAQPRSIWKQLFPQAVFGPLTSVTPSTTSAALTTLWTGKGPGAHGIVGYEMWLKEYGVIANMIQQGVTTFGSDPGGLKRAGFKPDTFLRVPTLGSYLQQNQIQPYAFMSQAIARSGLSTMHYPGVKVLGYRGLADLFISLDTALEETEGRRTYTYVYWEALDELSHRYGPGDQRVRIELDAFSRLFEREFLPRLSRRGPDDTLIVITADHGLIHTPINPDLELRNHRELARMLHLPPSGEHRFAYLFIRPEKVDPVARYVESHWPGRFCLIPAALALAAGLFGPDPALLTEDRIGDQILIARGDAYLWWADKENGLLGRHGGLSREEMLVPFFAFRV